MSKELLNSLLKEYEHKRLLSELDLERRKKDLYIKIPKLEEIENSLNQYAISTAKNILKDNDSSYLENLNTKINDLKSEKLKLLLKNGLSEDYLKPFYDCKICKDTGFIVGNNFKTLMCSCLKQKLLDEKYNFSNLYNIKKENFDNFNEKFFSNEINKEKYKQNISPRENINIIKKGSLNFIKNFDNPSQKNLLFTGNTGLRKKLYV